MNNGQASLLGHWAVMALFRLIILWFIGCVGYVLVGAVIAPFREARQDKEWAAKMEAQRQQILRGAP